MLGVDNTNTDRVSIHAPREGCDVDPEKVDDEAIKFQSTHPVRGATHDPIRGRCRIQVSIHAPREGCDERVKSRETSQTCFNPRTP